MLEKFYVGHEVLMCKKFTKFKYANNSTCCRIENSFFISRKCVLLRRNTDGSYFYLRNLSRCNVIDPNSLQVSPSTHTCENCNLKKNNSGNCELDKNSPVEIIGVLDIQPIQSFAKTTDLDLAISLIREYNSKINDDENYVYVDDISYIDIVREIDEGIGRRRIREINK